MAKSEEKYMGPLGLGDPDDLTLTELDREHYLRRYFRDLAEGQCKKEQERKNCCMAKYGIAGLLFCRESGSALKTCIKKCLHDPALIQSGTETYLSKRSEYRSTGEVKKEDDGVKPLDLSDIKITLKS